MGYSGTFSAGYDPNLQTSSSFSVTPLASEQLGGFNVEDLFNKMLRLRQKASNQASALASAPKPAPRDTSTLDRTRDFWTIKQDLDAVQSRDPWAGRGHGQTVGQSMFNMPAASALAYGRDIFPDPFKTFYAPHSGPDLRTQAELGPKPGMVEEQYDPKTGTLAGRRTTPATGGWGIGY